MQVEREIPYQTRSGRVPLPANKSTRIPPVRGTVTNRYRRFMKKCTRQDGTFDKDLASRKETSFFESKLKHMSAFLEGKTGKRDQNLLIVLC